MEQVYVKKVTALSGLNLPAFFDNGVCKLFNYERLLKTGGDYEMLKDPAFFRKVRVECGGFAVAWSDEVDTSEWALWDYGVTLPLTEDDLYQYIQNNTVGTAEACEILHCDSKKKTV